VAQQRGTVCQAVISGECRGELLAPDCRHGCPESRLCAEEFVYFGREGRSTEGGYAEREGTAFPRGKKRRARKHPARPREGREGRGLLPAPGPLACPPRATRWRRRAAPERGRAREPDGGGRGRAALTGRREGGTSGLGGGDAPCWGRRGKIVVAPREWAGAGQPAVSTVSKGAGRRLPLLGPPGAGLAVGGCRAVPRGAGDGFWSLGRDNNNKKKPAGL